MQQKVDFILQTAMTSSVTGPERSSKALPKGKTRQTAGWEWAGTLLFADKSQKMHMERTRESARHPMADRRVMADSGKAGAGNQDPRVLKPPVRPVASCKGVHASHRHV